MSGKKLNAKEVENLKTYLSKLSELDGRKSKIVQEWPDERIATLTIMFRHLKKFGDGDPIKAAYKHKRSFRWTQESYASKQ